MSETNEVDAVVMCGFNEAWIGSCKAVVGKAGMRCKKHEQECSSCGDPATKNCAETGQFVCGAPLCDNCEHTISEDGTNGGIGFNASPLPDGMKGHCKKSEQVFTPWHQRETESI